MTAHWTAALRLKLAETRRTPGIEVDYASLDRLLREHELMREALGKYKHCRHACQKCFCTKESTEALAQISSAKGADERSESVNEPTAGSQQGGECG